MSHSDDFKQKYLELYQLKQSAIANSLHSDLAQPIIAAKNFAAAIKNMDGQDESLLEAKQLAEYIVELTDQAYTIAYDLMIENESAAMDEPCESMKSAIKNYADLLRFKSRGITLNVNQNTQSIALTPFVNRAVLDWVKSFLIYLARHSKVSIINVSLMSGDSGFSLEIALDIAIDSNQIDSAPLVSNIREQIQVFDGSLLISNDVSCTCAKMFLPPTTEISMTRK